MNKEQLLSIFFDTKPSLKCPYALYGNPPMWYIGTYNGYDLYARPCKIMVRLKSWEPYTEVDGLQYQHHTGETWVGQGLQSTYESFEKYGPMFVR